MSHAFAKPDGRLVASMKIRTATDEQVVGCGKLFDKLFLACGVSGVDGFNAVKTNCF